MRTVAALVGVLAVFAFGQVGRSADTLGTQVLPLLKARCVKCHGPAKGEGKLDLSTAGGLARGGESGAAVVPANLDASILWEKISGDEMPPDNPLAGDEKDLIRRWIQSGATGLSPDSTSPTRSADHWSFRSLARVELPVVHDSTRVNNQVDCFIQSALEAEALTLAPPADAYTLIRRVSFDLTGLPPRPNEIEQFVADTAPGAYERMVDRYLASPRYGERWGKYWLDVAGYADSNGHFNADSDRPLAYRYRDYVLRSFNADKPLDQFIREQLAGDELAKYRPNDAATAEIIDQLVATHFLRNAQDGTGESDGNPDEVLADKMTVIEGLVQIVGSSFLGLTLHCARCHDHKFEPVTQRDYYQLQAVFAPAFDVARWVKPNDRTVDAALPAEIAAWELENTQIDAHVAALRGELAEWVRENRPRGIVQFQDGFDGAEQLAARWSNTAPGDDAPGGSPPVAIGSSTPPAAVVRDGVLQLIESGAPGDRWISTKQSFDWQPKQEGAWIQVTFDLVATLIAGGNPAERIGYFIGLHDFDRSQASRGAGGNILIDGNPTGKSAVYVDYPASPARSVGTVGGSGYVAGRNFGVRITNKGNGEYLLEHVVDGLPEEISLTLSAGELAPGGFGFEFCCGRSFVVDNVVVEASSDARSESAPSPETLDAFRHRRQELEERIKAKLAQKRPRPGKIAWVTDVSSTPPDVFVLQRGNYSSPAEQVFPAGPAVLTDPQTKLRVEPSSAEATTTGHRLAFARWLTQAGSRPAALLARITANRIWQRHFGVGLVATPDNLGYSGAAPSHPELLEFLAGELVRSGWSLKSLQRTILLSGVYRQQSTHDEQSWRIDPENRLLWHYPLTRLDAESTRDAILAVAGELDERMEGPYVPTQRTEVGEVIVDQSQAGARRRSIYLQQRRTQLLTLLEVFDAPSIVTNCTRRNSSTIPLQSLSLLNSDFALAGAGAFARRLEREAGSETEARIKLAFLLAVGRNPTSSEREACRRFLAQQPANYPDQPNAGQQSWIDLCQMLLASNTFLYIE